MNYAQYVNEHLFQAHRGVTRIGKKLVAFGNDGYNSDQRSQREVTLLRQRLSQLDAKEESFQVSSDGYSWAMVLKSRHHTGHLEEQIADVLWEGWFGKPTTRLNGEEEFFHSLQRQIALSAA